MASSTPVKETVVIKLTPTTKQFTCILCGENKQNRKDRQKLEHADGTPTNVHILIEKLISIRITSDSHSTMCCRPCGLRLQTIDKSLEKFKQTYSSVQKLHKQTHGQKVIKRMTSEHPMSTKRKALFPVEDNQENIEAVPIIDEVSLSYIIMYAKYRYDLITTILHSRDC